MAERVTALAGGVGAARLLRGIARLIPARRLTVIVNTGDDEEFYGLHVSPDLDTIVYNLAGAAPGIAAGASPATRRTCLPRCGASTGTAGSRSATAIWPRTSTARMRSLPAAGSASDRGASRAPSAFARRFCRCPTIRCGRSSTPGTAARLPFQEYFVQRRGTRSGRRLVLSRSARSAPCAWRARGDPPSRSVAAAAEQPVHEHPTDPGRGRSRARRARRAGAAHRRERRLPRGGRFGPAWRHAARRRASRSRPLGVARRLPWTSRRDGDRLRRHGCVRRSSASGIAVVVADIRMDTMRGASPSRARPWNSRVHCASARAEMPIQLIPLEGVPAIRPGDDLARCSRRPPVAPAVEDGDLLVVCQKAVSKAEGRVVDLARVHASAVAEQHRPRDRKGPVHRRSHPR